MKRSAKIQSNKDQSTFGIKSSFCRILSRTLIVLLPIFTFMIIGSISILLIEERAEMRVLLSTEQSYVNAKLDNIESEINHVIDNLLILSLN